MYSYLQVVVINSADNNLVVSEIKLDMLSSRSLKVPQFINNQRNNLEKI